MKKVTVEYINNQKQDFIVKESENYFEEQIHKLVTRIMNRKNLPKFILVAGPSSSGKTTTSHIIMNDLALKNINSRVISMDDFFLDRKETPLLSNGDKDYDSTKAIDWVLFEKVITNLSKRTPCYMPEYDFKEGLKVLSPNPIIADENEIFIIEGLHALNPIMKNYLDPKLSKKVFVSPEAEFYTNNKLVLDKYELRLIRRLVRDVNSRGIMPSETLKNWKNVRSAEDKYIIPFKDLADFKVDSTHFYEPLVYKTILKKLSKAHNSIIRSTLDNLTDFSSLNTDVVPKNSLLKEFVNSH